MSESDQGSAGNKPGRYNRSFGGLIGSMIVLVLAVAAFVLFRETFRDNPEIEPDAVDYLPLVASLQEAGREVVYPSSLPEGWIVTSVTATPGERPVWGLGMLTDDGTYVGVQQQDEDADDLLTELVDEQPVEGEPVEVPGSLAPAWDVWSDEGGDHAYVATVETDLGEETVVVYGSATVEDLETMVGLLTLDPVDPA